jgi:serine 3-dehydrogenase (NADP+)
MPVLLKDKVALVVGASSGVGRATALMLAREGAKVMASARRQDRLDDLRAEASAAGLTVETEVGDATDLASMERVVESARQKFGRIQIAIYVAGMNTPDRYLPRLRPDIWDEMIAANLNGAYYLTQAVLPAMREARDGHLIFVSSISGHTPDASGVAYQAGKRGLMGLSHGIRVEEKQNLIRTTVVCPGLIDTEFIDKRPVKPTPEQRAVAMLPEHVAEAILACAMMPPRTVISELSIVPTVM